MWVALGEPGKTSIKRLKINKRKCTNTSRHTEIRDKTIKTREHKFPAIKNSMFAIFSCIHLFVHTTRIKIHVYIGINIYKWMPIFWDFFYICIQFSWHLFHTRLLFLVRDFPSALLIL